MAEAVMNASSGTRAGRLAALDRTGVPVLLARLAVGGVFAYLAVMKLRDPVAFLKAVKMYGIVPLEPPLWLNVTAVVTPWIELVCAAFLVVGLWRRGAALVLSGMLLFFTPMLLIHAAGLYAAPKPGVVYASFCDVKFDCGCGTGEVYICTKVLENVLLLMGSVLILVSGSDRFGLARWLERRSP